MTRHDINLLREQLTVEIDKEFYALCRMKWNAKKHGCSEELFREIEKEAWELYQNCRAYPERVLMWDLKYKFKYAFRH